MSVNNEKLPKAFKKKWVNALLSGEYQQGHGKLKSNDKYCCLGVAAEIAGCKDIEGRGHIRSTVSGYKKVPSLLVKDSFEHTDSAPQSLASLNDDGVPFEIIAGVINEYL